MNINDTLPGSAQRGIVRRQKELHASTSVLARSARRYFWWSSLATWITVVLGASIATKDTMIGLFPPRYTQVQTAAQSV